MFLPFFFSVIFYWQATGEIYGVHKDIVTAPAVPPGVTYITVPSPPDKIAWPVPTGQTQGREEWSVVDTATRPPSLKAKAAGDITVDPDAELRWAIEAATTLGELKDALTGKTRAGQVKGRPTK